MPREINPNVWKGVDFWTKQIEKAGLTDKLHFFNDVLTGREKPGGYGEAVIRDVILDGRKCDIYHTGEGKNEFGARVYIHFKE
jgi:hypothetical protein